MDGFSALRTIGGMLLTAGLAILSVGADAEAERLPAYGVDLEQTSVSGISSGAYLAVQFHVAHSGIVRGAAVIAGGPYYWPENNSGRATRNCMKPDETHPVPDAVHLNNLTNQLAQSGAIDNPVQLRADRVWLFSGTEDRVVEQPVMNALFRYYRSYVGDDGIVYKKDLDVRHAMITETDGASVPQRLRLRCGRSSDGSHPWAARTARRRARRAVRRVRSERISARPEGPRSQHERFGGGVYSGFV